MSGIVATLSLLGAADAPMAAADATPKNGLSAEAFRANALTTNPTALGTLLHSELNSDLVAEPYINRQLHDADARAVMEDLVKCALGPKAKIQYVDMSEVIKSESRLDVIKAGKEKIVDSTRKHRPSYLWQGELGLCGSDSWGTNGPPLKCQQLVTSCLMARVNALHMSVPLSLRGPFSTAAQLDRPVVAETRFRESPVTENPSTGTAIGVFRSQCPGSGCPWEVGYVGTCAAGQATLAIHDRPAREHCAEAAIRICDGIHGCRSSPDDATPAGLPYSRHNSDHEVCKRSLEFTCPAADGTAGFFSVMFRPDASTHHLSVKAVTGGPAPGKYPASERDVFSFREGAFFGNLFDPSALAQDCEMTGGARVCGSPPLRDPDAYSTSRTRGPQKSAADSQLPYQKVYACYSSDLPPALAVEYLNARVCTDHQHQCFPNEPKPCAASSPAMDSANCALAGNAEYQNCHGPASDPMSYLAITSYLNEACDLLGEGPLCARVRTIAFKASAAVSKVEHGPRGCGGCSLNGAGGGLQPAVLAVLVALGLRRRRRSRSAAGTVSAASG